MFSVVKIYAVAEAACEPRLKCLDLVVHPLAPEAKFAMRKFPIGSALCLLCLVGNGLGQLPPGTVPVAPGRVALNVFFPPTDPHHPDYPAMQKYLLNKSAPAFSYIDGAVIRIDWSDFDLGDLGKGTHTRYDFRLDDEAIAP